MGLDTCVGALTAKINQHPLTLGRRAHYSQVVLDLNQIVQQTAKGITSESDSITCKLDLCDTLMKIKGGGAQIHRMLTILLVNTQDAMQNSETITITTTISILQ